MPLVVGRTLITGRSVCANSKKLSEAPVSEMVRTCTAPFTLCLPHFLVDNKFGFPPFLFRRVAVSSCLSPLRVQLQLLCWRFDVMPCVWQYVTGLPL